MNWRYLILPNYKYVDRYIADERVSVDELNAVTFKKWKHLDSFEDLLFEIKDNEVWVLNWFQELWDLIEEKWELFIFENKMWEKFYFYNAIDKIEAFEWNRLTFVEILYENRKEILEDKLNAYLNYIYSNNVDRIKALANTETIKSLDELILNLWNENFIQNYITKIDKIGIKEIYFLSKRHFYGWAWHTYLYAFKEEWGQLRPVRFNGGFNNIERGEELFDKVEVLIAFQWKRKINLFFEKIIFHTLFSNKELKTNTDIQKFYNLHIKE